jgi:hypothetical protein
MFFPGYNDIHLLSILALSPLCGILFLVQTREERNIQNCTLWVNVFTLLIAALAAWSVDFPINGFDLVELVPWLAHSNVSYHLGVDNLSIVLVLLLTVLFPAITIASFNQCRGGRRTRMMLLLGLEGCLLVAICAIDIIVLFIAFTAGYLCFLALIKASGQTLKRTSLIQLALGLTSLLIAWLKISALTGSFSFEIVRYEITNTSLEKVLIFTIMLALFSVAYPLGYIKRTFGEKESDFTIIDFVCTAPMLIGRIFLIYRFFPLVHCAEDRYCLYVFMVLFFNLYKLHKLASLNFNRNKEVSTLPEQPTASKFPSGHLRACALCLERILISFVLIDLLVESTPKSVLLLINYTLTIACVCLIPLCRLSAKFSTVTLSGVLLLCTGFPCWSYMNTLQKIITQDNWLIGITYVVSVFLFVGVIFSFIRNIEYIESQLCLTIEPNRQDFRSYVLSTCSIMMLAGSLITVNTYPYLLPPPINFSIDQILRTTKMNTINDSSSKP